MGVYCEINLHKPSDGVFRPGTTVAGTIMYALDSETVFKNITISLKGKGHLHMQRRVRQQKRTIVYTYVNNEEYVRQNCVVYDDQLHGKKPYPVGRYEAHFKLVLPERIPPSFSTIKHSSGYQITCKIQYYISIKFYKASFFSFNSKYKKDITVFSGISPKLPTVPTVCGQEKTLTQLFSNKKRTINLTANVKTCVIQPGGKIEVDYELANDSNIIVKGVKTKLVETYNFMSNCGRQVHVSESVKNTDSKSGSFNPGEVKTLHEEVILPSDIVSIDYSRMVVRDYILRLTASLPFPHRDMVVNVPLQIGNIDGAIVVAGYSTTEFNPMTNEAAMTVAGCSTSGFSPVTNEAPPSYWEVMSEDSEQTKKG